MARNLSRFIRQTSGKPRRPSRHDMDMTEGSLLPKIIAFSGPLMLTGILQLLFNAADIIVVGNFAKDGTSALAAVSSTTALINLLVNVFMGLSVGASVAVAKAWGARDSGAISRAVHTAITVAVISGFIVGLVGFVFAKDLLILMGNPDETRNLAALYIKIYFVGMPVNMLYNFGAAVLRATGDTKRPLYYLTISGVVNVCLNLLLVIVFGMSVDGVAIATISSQAVSAALVILCLRRSHGPTHLDFKKLGIDRKTLLEIVRVGLPAGLQGSLFSISNVMIQSSINSFGSFVMAGSGASSSLEGFVYMAMNAVYQAALTFSSQNWGAGKLDRVKRVMWLCLGTVTVIGLALGLLVWALGRPLLSVYIQDGSENFDAVLEAGLVRMSVILPTYWICGMMDVMVGQLRGVGCSIVPMVVSLTGVCVFRILWIATVFQVHHTPEILYLSYPATWAVTFAAHLISWYVVSPKLFRRRREDLAGQE